MLLELPHDSSSLKGSVCFAIRGKKEWKNNLGLFAILAVILPLIWSLFCLNVDNTHYLIYM